MSTLQDTQIESLKAALMPQLDEGLRKFVDAMNDSLHFAATSEIDRCITIVAAVRGSGAKFEDRATRHAFEGAIDIAVEQLKSWKTKASERTPPSESGNMRSAARQEASHV